MAGAAVAAAAIACWRRRAALAVAAVPWGATRGPRKQAAPPAVIPAWFQARLGQQAANAGVDAAM